MKPINLIKNLLPVAAVCAFIAGTAHAVVVDFDEYASGTIIDTEYQASHGFTVDVLGNGSPDIGVLYNTDLTNGRDPDLEGGADGTLYTAGNLDGVAQGNALIIQENAGDREILNGSLRYSSGTNDYRGNAPDDNAAGGQIAFSFDQDLVGFGFDWLDLDSGENVNLTLIDSVTGAQAVLDFGMFTNSGSDFYDSSVQFGDHTANQISMITLDGIAKSSQVNWTGGTSSSPASFDKVVFDLSGSGAISAISFAPVPEVSTVVGAFALGAFVVVGAVRNRRKRQSA